MDGHSIATPSDGGKSFGRVESKILLWSFKGTEKINTLEAYPIQYHQDPEAMKTFLLERGRKWASLKGIHHVHYEGTAAFAMSAGGRKKIIKYNVRTCLFDELSVPRLMRQ